MAGFNEPTNAVGWLAIRSNALLASLRPLTAQSRAAGPEA
jgi:hypothetical protein